MSWYVAYTWVGWVLHSLPCYVWIRSVSLETNSLRHRRHFQDHEMPKGSFRLRRDLIYGGIDSFPSENVSPWNKIQAIDLPTYPTSINRQFSSDVAISTGWHALGLVELSWGSLIGSTSAINRQVDLLKGTGGKKWLKVCSHSIACTMAKVCSHSIACTLAKVCSYNIACTLQMLMAFLVYFFFMYMSDTVPLIFTFSEKVPTSMT